MYRQSISSQISGLSVNYMIIDKSIKMILLVVSNQDLANELKIQLENENYVVDINPTIDMSGLSDSHDILVVDLDSVSQSNFYESLSNSNQSQELLYIGSIEQILAITDPITSYLIKDEKKHFIKLIPTEVNRLLAHRNLLEEKQALTEENRQLTKGLEEFAQTIGHEIKSPISTIVSYASILVSEYHSISDDEAVEFLNLIETLSIKASNVVDTLLLLASIPHLKDLPLEPIDIEKLMYAVDIRLRDSIMDTHCEITLSDLSTTGIGYEPWVEEIMVNLVSNAIKYGGGPPKIMVGADVVDDDFVRFWIKDNGRGLTKEEISKLFVPFTRLEHIEVEGHGLGLSIVRQIVERLGGTVGVDSKPEKGSTFFFTLPRANQS